MKAHFRNAALIAAFFCIAPIAFADPPKSPRISLAGTFNNWNTSDPDYTLKPVGDRFELVRAWPCGTSEFKFVFDGSWSKHLGDAGDGKLVQPGGDIKLVVPQSGTYSISLDLSKSMWGLDRTTPLAPRAAIQKLTTASDFDGAILDGRLSESRKNGKALQYKWTLIDSDSSNVKLVPIGDGESGFVRIEGIDRKPVSVSLTVNDGEESEPAIFIVKPKATSTPGAQPRDRHGRFTRATDAATPDLVKFKIKGVTRLIPKGMVIERIDLVGDFNGWNPNLTPMHLAQTVNSLDDVDQYECIVELRDGVHHYKYLVNGVHRVADPNADPKLTDADGNSGVRCGPDPGKLGPVKPNDIVAAGLFHDPSNNAWFAPIASDAANVTVRTLANDVQSIGMHIEGLTADVQLRRLESRDGFDYWKCQVVAGNAPWRYSFTLSDGTATLRMMSNDSKPADKAFQGPSDMHFKTPDWAKSVVWYQIFPERFRNGDTSNDPPGTVPWKHAWFKPYKGPSTGGGTIHEKGGFFNYIYDRRYGGDLQGVRDRLPYLRELGVTAIYFNPIFLAESLHKYDASDYRHIDDFFGVKDSLKKIKGETDDPKTWQWSETDKLFLDFLQEAHRQGFKVVLDGVFNHVGRDFWAFKDVMKNGEKSPYAGWFDIESFKPFHYKAWDKPDGSLPRLKHDEALGLATPVREHIFGITRRWMDPNGDGNPSDGIDGWRLDVAADINVNFWRDWRALVKKTNPDAYIVAELWQESRVWLDGQSFDAVMNYPFAVRSQRFFVNNKKASKPSQFLKEIHEILGWYAPHVNHCLQNLYDSHDTDRLASMFLNPDLEYDQTNRPQDNGPNYNTGRPTAENYHRMKLAVTWQMMFLGSPMIYYGNEVGMFGADDPTDRKPMLWPDLLPYDDADEKIDSSIFEHHQRMIAIRNTYRAIRLGSFESVYDDDKRGIVAFVRRLGKQAVLVVINNSDKQRRVRLPTPWDGKGEVYRVDDPSVAEIKAAAGPQHRATIAIKPDAKTPIVIEKGAVKGITLAPRTAGVYVLVESK